MHNMNERPVCHRAEDLVTYLYGEASAAEAADFATHAQQCDACRTEFAAFQQVHESIADWRSEALGTSPLPASPIALAPDRIIENRFEPAAPRLSGWAALSQFFSVSPLWLRGATALASLLFCVLVGLTFARMWPKPVVVSTPKNSDELKYTKAQLDQAVKEQVEARIASLQKEVKPLPSPPVEKPRTEKESPQLAKQPRPQRLQRNKGVSAQEWEQLAADLGLIPNRDNDELPFAFSEEPE